jgi:hypothetical protein
VHGEQFFQVPPQFWIASRCPLQEGGALGGIGDGQGGVKNLTFAHGDVPSR